MKPGDVMFGTFDYDEDRSQKKIRPLLILEVMDWGVRVAFGSSQHTGGALPHEFELEADEAAHVYLKKATRFDLKRRQIMPLDVQHPAWAHKGPVGNILSLGRDVQYRLVRTARNAGLA